jgi:hypothetical protein
VVKRWDSGENKGRTKDIHRRKTKARTILSESASPAPAGELELKPWARGLFMIMRKVRYSILEVGVRWRDRNSAFLYAGRGCTGLAKKAGESQRERKA